MQLAVLETMDYCLLWPYDASLLFIELAVMEILGYCLLWSYDASLVHGACRLGDNGLLFALTL